MHTKLHLLLDSTSLDTTQILAARQADGSLAEGTLLHLAAGSALIDAGTDVGLSYTGAAPDLGCYETDGILHPTITCTSDNSEQWLTEGEDISPIVFQWGGAATKLKCSDLPTGITYKISNTNKTLTLSGNVEQAGTYTITVSTVSAETEVNSLSATLHIKSSACKKVGFITVPDSPEDALILNKLHSSDSLAVTILDAAATDTDYSLYDVLILGAKPNSGATAFAQLKGYDKPMLVLKPFLYKSSVWNWGTPANTQEVAVYVPDTTHAIFQNINFRGSNELVLFSQCNTNAVTAITDWTQEGICLASPVSQSTYTTIADMPAGTVVGGTTLLQRLVTIGISEYSTAYLTNEALQVLENTVYYLLSLPLPQGPTQEVATDKLPHPAVRKVCTPQGIRLFIGDKTYDLLGNLIQ